MPVPRKGVTRPLTPGSPPPIAGSFVSLDSELRAPLPDEIWGSAGLAPQEFYETGPKTGQVPAGSTKVGFTLRDSSNRILAGFAFRINPQGLSYSLGSRGTMNAVKSGFFVDDFGPAASAISLRQIVINGANAYSTGPYYTGRQDVQRFLRTIYLPATQGLPRTQRRVFFHDHHFERGFEQRVVFLPNSLSIERGIDQPGIWLVELQMISLEKYPYDEVNVTATPTATGRRYQVKRGDTLEKIVRTLTGKGSSALSRERLQRQLLQLNPQIAKRRAIPGDQPGDRSGKPMKIYPGELLALPG